MARQTFFTKFQDRLSDQEAAAKTLGHGEEHSDRKHNLYNPTLEQIMSNPVPFDANVGSDGKLKDGGKLGH